jgi:hypothetical protein
MTIAASGVKAEEDGIGTQIIARAAAGPTMIKKVQAGVQASFSGAETFNSGSFAVTRNPRGPALMPRS